MKKYFAFVLLSLTVLLPAAAFAQEGREITIPIKLNAGTREAKALVYAPSHGKPAPAVLVLHTDTPSERHETDDERYARALAKEGFVAIVPDYVILGRKRYWNVPMQMAIRQIAGHAQSLPEVAGKPVGTVGFSLGVVGLLASPVAPQIKAVVVYYGAYDPFAAKNFERQPGSIVPLDDKIAQGVNAAALILHGEKDDEIPASQAKDMHEKLKRFGKTSELVIYPGAYHRFDRGFSGGGRTKYTYEVDGAARDDAFKRTVAWLRRHLGQ
jgi:dienelactone hydrolase